MALKATIYKAELQIADMDRNYYQEHLLTLARHPSETDERMMIRLLAFALHASQLWIEVGQPDEKRLMKACGRSEHVIVYSYSATSHIWYKGIANKLERAKNLEVINIPDEASVQLEKMAKRNMQLQCTIQDGQVWLTDSVETVLIERESFKALRD